MQSTDPLGARQRELLRGWRRVAGERPSGVGYDFVAPPPGAELRTALERFRAEPSEDAFHALWRRENLPGAPLANAGFVLNSWDGTIEDLAEFLTEVADADRYDQAWESTFPEQIGLWEFYTRLHPDAFIVDGTTRDALAKFGVRCDRNFEALTEGVDEFATVYRDAVGRVTEGTEYEVPLRRELDELFHLVTNRYPEGIRAEFLDEERILYRPLIDWDGSELFDAQVRLDTARVEAVLDAYPENPEVVYNWDETPDAWGGTYVEIWKHRYSEYVQDAIVPEFDLGSLTADDVEPLLDRYDDSDATELSGSGLRKLMGGQYGSMAVGRFIDAATDEPGVAATVLSDLFEPGVEYRGSRLAAFNVEYGEVIGAPGQTMRLATTLLMVTYPQEYIVYQHGKFSEFFADVADYDVGSGFNPDEYHQLNAACLEIKERLQERQPEASMLDVQSIIWIYAGENTRTPT